MSDLEHFWLGYGSLKKYQNFDFFVKSGVDDLIGRGTGSCVVLRVK